MATQTVTLTWQWGGETAHRSIMAVASIKKQGGGLFGLNNSPSIAGNLPDGRIVTGKIIAGSELGETLVLRIPNHELPPVRSGGLLAIAYTADNRAIFVAVPPAAMNTKQNTAWLANWQCQPAPQ